MSLLVRVGGLLGAGVAVLAYLLLASGRAQSATEPTSASERAVIARLAAFQRAEGSGDAIPGNTTLAGMTRRIGPSSAGQTVWASLNEEQLCVQVGEDGASACTAPERFTRALIVGSSRRGPDAPAAAAASPQQLAGVVCDGIASVTVLFADGTSETVPVVDNGFYLYTDERAIRQFDWTTSSGEVIHGAEVR